MCVLSICTMKLGSLHAVPFRKLCNTTSHSCHVPIVIMELQLAVNQDSQIHLCVFVGDMLPVQCVGGPPDDTRLTPPNSRIFSPNTLQNILEISDSSIWPT